MLGGKQGCHKACDGRWRHVLSQFRAIRQRKFCRDRFPHRVRLVEQLDVRRHGLYPCQNRSLLKEFVCCEPLLTAVSQIEVASVRATLREEFDKSVDDVGTVFFCDALAGLRAPEKFSACPGSR